jgi:hypothetical protein
MDADYNLSTLVADVKDELQDESYDDNRIIRYINQTYFETFGEVPYSFFEKTYDYQTLDSGELEVPNDFQTLERLVVEKDNMKWPLKYVAPREYYAAYKGLKVYLYTVIGNKVHYYLPKIDCKTINDNDPDNYYTLKMLYIAKPTKLENDEDVPLIPSEYGEILIFGALARAERRRGNFDYAQIYDNQKAELITNMAMRYGPRQFDGGNRIQTPFNIRINEV